jgi:hypothetical protein
MMRKFAFIALLIAFSAGPASAGISFIGRATGTTSATLPAFNAGDFAIVFAFRDGSTVAPTTPAGWTNILAPAGANTCSMKLGFRILQTGDTTTGTWTNATSVVVHVYRGVTAIGGSASASGASTTVSYPALTMQAAQGTSWVAGFAGHRSVDTALETPPTGMINRSDVVDATDEAAGHDTNGGVTSWTLQTVSVGGTSSGWFGSTVELIATSNTPANTLAQDNFNRLDGGLGTSWTTVTAVDAPTIVSGSLRDPATGGTDAEAFYNAASLPDDQWAQVYVLKAITATSRGVGVLLRQDPAGTRTHYRVMVEGPLGATATVAIQKHVSGTFTPLTSTTTTVNQGDVLYGEVQGSTLVAKVNGTQVLSTTDTEIPSGAAAGIVVFVDAGTTADAIVDDWFAGNFAAPPSGAPSQLPTLGCCNLIRLIAPFWRETR